MAASSKTPGSARRRTQFPLTTPPRQVRSQRDSPPARRMTTPRTLVGRAIPFSLSPRAAPRYRVQRNRRIPSTQVVQSQVPSTSTNNFTSLNVQSQGIITGNGQQAQNTNHGAEANQTGLPSSDTSAMAIGFGRALPTPGIQNRDNVPIQYAMALPFRPSTNARQAIETTLPRVLLSSPDNLETEEHEHVAAAPGDVPSSRAQVPSSSDNQGADEKEEMIPKGPDHRWDRGLDL